MSAEENRTVYTLSSVEITEGEYLQASLLTARRYGALRTLPVYVVAAVVLLAAGFGLWPSFYRMYQTAVVPFVLCLCSALLLVGVLWLLPRMVREQAGRDYGTYRRLWQKATVVFERDTLRTQTPALQASDPYALMLQLVETPTLLVFIKDGGKQLVVPKRCLPPEQSEAMLAFLRHAFTRRYRAMRTWLW